MTSDPIRISARLLDIRDTYRRLAEAGHETWPTAGCERLMRALIEANSKSGLPVLTLAARAAKRAGDEGNSALSLAFLAAAVDIVDPVKP
jgi:hypothetical protein